MCFGNLYMTFISNAPINEDGMKASVLINFEQSKNYKYSSVSLLKENYFWPIICAYFILGFIVFFYFVDNLPQHVFKVILPFIFKMKNEKLSRSPNIFLFFVRVHASNIICISDK